MKEVAAWTWSFIIAAALMGAVIAKEGVSENETALSVVGGFLLLWLIVRGFWAWGKFTINYARRDKKRRLAQQGQNLARKERELSEGVERFPGHVSSMSQYADPASGQGTLIVSNRQIRWETTGGLRQRADGAYWAEVVTFARREGLVQIEWRTSGLGGMPPMAAVIQFRGHVPLAQLIEAKARTVLAPENWQQNVDLEAEAKWDTFWSADA